MIKSALGELKVKTIELDGIPIPVFAREEEYSGKKRANATIKTAKFHTTHIIPRQIFFNITQTPIVCYESDCQSEALSGFDQNTLQTIIIEKQLQTLIGWAITKKSKSTN